MIRFWSVIKKFAMMAFSLFFADIMGRFSYDRVSNKLLLTVWAASLISFWIGLTWERHAAIQRKVEQTLFNQKVLAFKARRSLESGESLAAWNSHPDNAA